MGASLPARVLPTRARVAGRPGGAGLRTHRTRSDTQVKPRTAPRCATAARPPCLRLAWVSLAWASLAWVSLVWVSLVWVSLAWVSLAWVSAGLGQPNLTHTRSDPAPFDPYRKISGMGQNSVSEEVYVLSITSVTLSRCRSPVSSLAE